MPHERVVVVTVRKSFWASPESEAFPNRVEARVFFGHSTHLVNSVVAMARALAAVRRRRPEVVVLGSVERLVPWFIRAKAWGLLGGARLVVTNQLHLSGEQLRHVDRVIVYASAFVRDERFVFVPLPADGDFEQARANASERDVVFTGGGAGRDFRTAVEAVRGTGRTLELVTFSPESLGHGVDLPPNVHVLWRMPVDEFLARMAGASFVVVPLLDPASPHGQTTVVQALALGKAVVATRSPGVADYVADGSEGLLVEAGDVDALRAAIERLSTDEAFRAACERRALERARGLTYAAFRDRLAAIVADVAAR